MKYVYIFLSLFILSLLTTPKIALARTQVNLSAPEDAIINVDIKDSSGDVQVTLNGETVMTGEGTFEQGSTVDSLNEVIEDKEYDLYVAEIEQKPEADPSAIDSVITFIRSLWDSLSESIQRVLG